MIQYTIVCIILLAAIIWAAIKFSRAVKGKASSCAGCGLKDNCDKQKKKDCPK